MAAPILALMLVPAARAAPPAMAQTETNHLLDFVGSSGCEFYRNGSWYDAKRAQAHLRSKYQWLGIAITGSAVLDIAAKNYFARVRPDLWLSLTPETTYSFPSGHAMGSATLGMALIALCWPTRWRWPVTLASLVFVLLVGVSRVYLGVHYPSDILAGWSAAVAWVFAMHVLVDRKAPPPADAAPSKDTVGTGLGHR
jgi:membrane-associated phospholipid phosphatase